jgi:hypothetical protein
MPHIGGRKKNFLVDENFIDVITEGLKNPQKLCEMKDRLLQEEISLADNTTTTTTTTSSKRPVSQTIVDDASRPWVDT